MKITTLVRRAAIAAACVVSTQTMAGGSLDISLADTTARIGWDATRMDTGLHLNLAALHESSQGDIVSGGVHVVDVRNPNSDLYIGVGANAYGIITDDYDGAAIGVGGFARYNFPFNRNFGVSGHAYYAPPVISFSDVSNFVDADVRVHFNILPTAHLYTGFRMTSVSFEDRSGRYKIGDGLHLGLKLNF
ncbi:YfaZ family outer membrane protein [Thalassolituus sp.]|uniref:YfaZ family outer membrane protein n=1 Tax=Thalassolituus sp. TaxID=2030822 RepID=UPI003511A50F